MGQLLLSKNSIIQTPRLRKSKELQNLSCRKGHFTNIAAAYCEGVNISLRYHFIKYQTKNIWSNEIEEDDVVVMTCE